MPRQRKPLEEPTSYGPTTLRVEKDLLVDVARLSPYYRRVLTHYLEGLPNNEALFRDLCLEPTIINGAESAVKDTNIKSLLKANYNIAQICRITGLSRHHVTQRIAALRATDPTMPRARARGRPSIAEDARIDPAIKTRANRPLIIPPGWAETVYHIIPSGNTLIGMCSKLGFATPTEALSWMNSRGYDFSDMEISHAMMALHARENPAAAPLLLEHALLRTLTVDPNLNAYDD